MGVTMDRTAPTTPSRIRWNHDERERFIAKAVDYQLDHPEAKMTGVLREAMVALPQDRRRHVRAQQAFEAEVAEITQRIQTIKDGSHYSLDRGQLKTPQDSNIFDSPPATQTIAMEALLAETRQVLASPPANLNQIPNVERPDIYARFAAV